MRQYRANNYVKKYRLLAAHHRASRRARRRYGVILVPALQQFSPLEDYVWWVSAGKKHASWWFAVCEAPKTNVLI